MSVNHAPPPDTCAQTSLAISIPRITARLAQPKIQTRVHIRKSSITCHATSEVVCINIAPTFVHIADAVHWHAYAEREVMVASTNDQIRLMPDRGLLLPFQRSRPSASSRRTDSGSEFESESGRSRIWNFVLGVGGVGIRVGVWWSWRWMWLELTLELALELALEPALESALELMMIFKALTPGTLFTKAKTTGTKRPRSNNFTATEIFT
ncbi:hypothetical protein BU17DRAFT_68595 [Hysterangium stoloniferum]|nr:hypothetical protein BU17DRAFT_68595 [Hysterangium stoloniferum]